MNVAASVRILPSPLYVVCDAAVCARAGWTLVDFAEACLEGGARFLQVRAKSMPARDFFAATDAILRRANRAGAVVVVNDRVDIARLAGAGGVHLGQEDLPPAQAREIAGANAVIGLSTHTPAQLDLALHQPVNYVAVGPVFATMTKETGYAAVGLDYVRHAAARAAARSMPLVAIGGMTIERARLVIRSGAQSVAVISDLLATGDPAARVREFLDALG